jgi:hypothetical protein
MNDAMLEKVADQIWMALKPLRHFHDEYDEGMLFDKFHEEAELNLMRVVESWYHDGFKNGVNEEKASWEYTNE